MKRYVIGDIHGRYKALIEVLQKANFDYNTDKLIVLGDIVDGGTKTYEVIEELLKINNLVYVLGNHDEWFIKHISGNWLNEIWIQQGGANTLKSYGAKVNQARFISEQSEIDLRNMVVPITHQNFLNKGMMFYVEDNMVFVHGGLNPAIPKIESQSNKDLLWDRNIINYAEKNKILNYDKVFIGHTTTQFKDNIMHPLKFNNLIMMDCGAGWNGKLAIMNIDTEEYYLSKQQIALK